jgi:hypothetical protein
LSEIILGAWRTHPGSSGHYVSANPQGPDLFLAEADNADQAVYRLRAVSPKDAMSWSATPLVLSVRLFVPDEWRSEVRDWLDQEHSAAMLGVPGCRWYRGYESTDGPFNFLNLWGLDTAEVIETPAWAAARDTPWRGRLMPAFADTRRAVYRLAD